MKDDHKCHLDKKVANGKHYYRCIPRECDKECFIYVLWEYIEKIGLNGKKEIVGTSVKEVGCECLTVDRWDGRDAGPQSCKAEMRHVGQVQVGGKNYEKTIVRCIKDGCDKECAFFIKYKNPAQELGPMDDSGCDCIDWKAP